MCRKLEFLLTVSFGVFEDLAIWKLYHFFVYSNGSVVVDFLIYTSRDFTGTLQDLQDALAGVVNNSYLGPFEVSAAKISGRFASYYR